MNNVVPTPPTRPETLSAPSPRQDTATEAPRAADTTRSRCAPPDIDPYRYDRVAPKTRFTHRRSRAR